MKKMTSRHHGIEASRHKAATVGRVGMWNQGIKVSKRGSPRRAFTLLELMIAVAVLVVVIVATTKIFGTVGKVAGLGEATADVLQEAAAIERQIRADIERLSQEGVFAIRCVSISNDINFGAGGALINPLLPEKATIRADQLVFFTNSIQGIQTYRQGAGSNHKGQGTAARIYYGHAFQVPGAGAVQVINNQEVRSHDPVDSLDPWFFAAIGIGMERTVFRSNSGGIPADYSTFPVESSITGNQPIALEWLLARQAIVLADDDGSAPLDPMKTVFLNNNRTAFWIGDAVVRSGRVDAAASQLNDIRSYVTLDGTRFWNDPPNDQRTIIADEILFYPRAERVAPGMHRVDQALTNHVLASGCSSFIVDWTYEDGVGFTEAPNPIDPDFLGVVINSSREQPWFGLDADFNGDGNLDRGVLLYEDADWWDIAQTIDPQNVEQVFNPSADLQIYEAFFGYNQTEPLDVNGAVDSTLGYTPWPSAIRITMVLHDPKSKLENGRVVQFVINLPKRAN